ncbi:MAG: helix-turn-helix transcriptional regulator [Candidatus Heimdallarchaeota archaeon]
MNKRIRFLTHILILGFIFNAIIIINIVGEKNELSLPRERPINQGVAIKQARLFTIRDLNKNLSRLLYKLSVNVDENGNDAEFSAQFMYQNTGYANVSYILHRLDIVTILTNNRLSSIIVYDSKGNLYYQWGIFTNYHLINISLRKPLEPFGFYSFTVSYILENSIVFQAELNKLYIFEWSITHDEDVEQFSLILTLPTPFKLYNKTNIEPAPNFQSSDGRRLEWNYNNIKMDDTQTWIVRFQEYPSTDNINTFNMKFWAFLIVTFLLGGIVGSLSTYFYLKSKAEFEKKEIVETLLSEPEREILEIIKRENGVTTQSKIGSISGFSKAKVSYYLSQLEEKGVIQRERWGRMNRIKIIDESFD